MVQSSHWMTGMLLHKRSGEKCPRVKRAPKSFVHGSLLSTGFPDLWCEKAASEELQDTEELRLPTLKGICGELM